MIDPDMNLPDTRGNSSLRAHTDKRISDWTARESQAEIFKRASKFLDDVPSGARRFLEHVLSKPHYQADADELKTVLGLASRRSVGSTTSVFGHLRGKHQMYQPFEVRQFKGSKKVTIYFIPHEIAGVLKRVM